MFLPSTFLFIFSLIGLGPQNVRYGGPPGIFGVGARVDPGSRGWLPS